MIIHAEEAGDFLYGKIRMSKQPFGLQYQFVFYI